MDTSTDISRLALLTRADETGALGWAAATSWRYRRAYQIAKSGDPDIPTATDVVGVTYWADRNQRWLPFSVHDALMRPAREVLEDDTLQPEGPATVAKAGAAILAMAVAVRALRALRRNGGDRL